jgi:micrococcal nuclease
MSQPWKPPYRRRGRIKGGEVGVAALAGLCIGFAVLSPEQHASATPGGEIVSDPWAVSITDGDTFRYRGDRIRIADIDTPEVSGRCLYENRLAAQATARMEVLLRAGPFELHPIQGRDEDRYGRKLRVVTRDGRSLGDQLVAEGLARTWTGRREPWCPA